MWTWWWWGWWWWWSWWWQPWWWWWQHPHYPSPNQAIALWWLKQQISYIHTNNQRNDWPKGLGEISGYMMVGCEKSSSDNSNISSLHQDVIAHSLHEKVLLKSFQQVEWVYLIIFLLNSIHVIIQMSHNCRCDSTFLAWKSSFKKFRAGGVGLCGGLRASGGSGLERDLSLSSGEHPPTLPIFNQDSIPWKEPKISFCVTYQNFHTLQLILSQNEIFRTETVPPINDWIARGWSEGAELVRGKSGRNSQMLMERCHIGAILNIQGFTTQSIRRKDISMSRITFEDALL